MHSISITLMIVRTKLVLPEAKGDQKICHFNILEEEMGCGALYESTYHQGKTGIHSELIYSVCSIKFSTDMLWSPMKDRLHFMLPTGKSMEKNQRGSSSPHLVQVNRQKKCLNSMYIVWRERYRKVFKHLSLSLHQGIQLYKGFRNLTLRQMIL